MNGKSFELAGLSGREGISELFEFTIDLRPSEEVSVTSLDEFNLLCESTAHLAFGYEYDQRIFGVVRRVQMLPSTNREGTPYRLSLVPRLWDATLTVRSRVFQDLSVRQIVEAILKETGLVEGKDYVFHLETDYSAPEYKRQYTVQYEESNYEFISRLMEHEGIFFFFRHDAGRDILVIADSNSAFEELPGDSTLFFNSEGASTELREEVTSIDCTVRVLPNQVYVREYNWRSPRLLVHAKADIGLKKKPEDKIPRPVISAIREDNKTTFGAGYVFQYGEHCRDEDSGPAVKKAYGPDERSAQRIAKIRAEEINVSRVTLTGTCRAPRIRPGHWFKLEDHFLGEAIDGQYVVVSLEHGYSQSAEGGGQDLGSRFIIAPHRYRYRPPRKTPRPRIHGLITGFIDGEQTGTPAALDLTQQGRYRVMLPFDDAAELGGKASRWIRMAQVSSGDDYGIHFPLHLGTEVLLAHINGDPDRPIIVGSLPNAETATPVKKATQSVIRTHGQIHIEFEDDA